MISLGCIVLDSQESKHIAHHASIVERKQPSCFKVSYLGARINYYSDLKNGATFQLSLLPAGDINPNPGPDAQVAASSADHHPIQHEHQPYMYSRCQLLGLNSMQHKLSPQTWLHLKSLGLNQQAPTRRGAKGGTRKYKAKNETNHSLTSPSTHHGLVSSLSSSTQDAGSPAIPVGTSPPRQVAATNMTNNYRSTTGSAQTSTPIAATVPRPPSSEFQHNLQCNFALWNARSLNGKVSMLCDVITERSINIITITETWLTGDHRDNHTLVECQSSLPNYRLHHIPRSNRKLFM